MPSITVVIATYNRSALLRGALDALALQEDAGAPVTIAVADNGSTDDTRAAFEEARSRAPQFDWLYVWEPRPGKSCAVNSALDRTTGDWVVFTDDDVRPEPGWLAAVARAFRDSEVDFVVGRIRPSWLGPVPAWVSPALLGALGVPDNGAAPRTIALGENEEIMPIGTNMAVRRAAIERVGGLRPDLGKLRGTLRSGEDHEFYLRLLHHGCRGAYVPDARVCHLVPPERLTRRYFRQWFFQNGRNVATLEGAYAPRTPLLLGLPRYLWREGARHFLQLMRSAIGFSPATRFRHVIALFWFAGYAREAWARAARARDRSPVPRPGGTRLTMATPQRDSAARNLMTGTATNYVLLAVTILLGALMMPFNVHHLGKTDYGLWMLVASMTYYFQILDLGYGNGLVRHVTAADARGDVDGMNAILSTFVVVYIVLGAIAFTGVILLAIYAVPRFPHLSPAQVTTGRWVLVALGLRIAVGFPMTVFGAVTNARQRFALNTWVAIVVALFNALITYVVLETGHGLRTLVPATVALSLLSYVAYAAVARHVFPQLRLRPSRFSRAHLREVTAFSVYLFLISISSQIGFNLDNLVIGAFIGTAAIAVYSVAARLADYQRQLCNQFNGLLFPVVVDFEARGDTTALRATLIDGTRLAVGLVAGVTLALLAFARPLIVRWIGPGFVDSIPALYALAIAGIVLVGQGPLGNILLVVGRHRLVAFGSLIESLLNLVLSIVLVRRLGITGAALGTMIAVVGVNVFVLVPVACRALEIRVLQFARQSMAPALVATLPALVAAWLLRGYVAPESLGAILACGATVGLIYLGAFALIGLDATDRARYRQYLRRFGPGRRRVAAAA